MNNETQTPSASPVPEYQPPGEPESATPKTNTMVMIGLVAGAAVLGAVLWWWMAFSDKPWADSYPTPTPAAQEDELDELDQVNVESDFDAEFQQIDQDLEYL